MRLPSTAQLTAIQTMNITGIPMANISTDCATLSHIVLSGAFGDGCEVFGRACFLGDAVVVLSAGASETGTSRPDDWPSGDFVPGVAAVATSAPQLPQKAVPASNGIPHFVQKAIGIPRGSSWSRLFSSYRAIPLLVKEVNKLLIGDAEVVLGFCGFLCVWIKAKHERYRD